MDNNVVLFQNKQETWDEKTCIKKAKHIHKDGLGTPYPFLGYIGSNFGEIRYNGGCIRENEWYQGENFPFPVIHKDFEIFVICSWGYFIRKKGTGITWA